MPEGDAGRVAAALGDLPLAVSHAGAYLAETGMAVAEYLRLLEARATDVLAQGAPGTYPPSLAASYQLAFDQLVVQEPAALESLTLAAHLAPEPIPFTLFTAHADRLPDRLTAAVTDPLVFASRPLGAAGEDVAWLLDTAALYLLTRGEPGPARPLFERALADRRRMLGEDHPDTLGSVNNLAADLGVLGEYERARELDEDTLTRRRRVLGERCTLRSASNLAADLRALGQYKQARQLERQIRSRRRS